MSVERVDGRFVKGVSGNPNGRPKKNIVMKEIDIMLGRYKISFAINIARMSKK